jgi:hypothetical protein
MMEFIVKQRLGWTGEGVEAEGDDGKGKGKSKGKGEEEEWKGFGDACKLSS